MVKQNRKNLLIGTYTHKGSEGIYPLSLDLSTGQLASAGQPLPLANPSWLAALLESNQVFAAGETGSFQGQPGGSITSLSWEEAADGSVRMQMVDQTSSVGSGPCHLLVNSRRRQVVAANYGSGSAYTCLFDQDGRFIRDAGGKTKGILLQHSGHGPDPARQQGPHVHFIGSSPDDRGILIVDLGLDQISYYLWSNLDPEKADIRPEAAFTAALPGGSGPRHLVSHPSGKWLYVVCELSSQILAYHWQPDGMELIQTVATLPEDFAGSSTTAAIRISSDGRWLLASNRGHDSLVICEIDPESGRIKARHWADCGGRTPRDFALVDSEGEKSWILVANQDDHRVVAMAFDRESGQASAPASSMDISMPVRIQPLP